MPLRRLLVRYYDSEIRVCAVLITTSLLLLPRNTRTHTGGDRLDLYERSVEGHRGG